MEEQTRGRQQLGPAIKC